MRFWRRNLGAARLAVLSQFEYRLNLAVDAAVQPILTAIVEIILWMAIFASVGANEIGGFGRESYLAYSLWAVFFGRIASTWMYEFRMIDEIDTGKVNAILTRPISFYEYYLGQFLGYKFLTCGLSFLVPLIACLFIESPVDLAKLPLAIALLSYYLIFVHTLSFTIASLAFFWNRVGSITVAKNLLLWTLTGELFPLDLIPQPFRDWVLLLPFRCAVFTPVGYLTGRVPVEAVIQGFVSVSFSILVMALVATFVWQKGRRAYTGQGA